MTESNLQRTTVYLRNRLPDYLRGRGLSLERSFPCLNPAHNGSEPLMSYSSREQMVRCPVCGAKVERDEDGSAMRCTGAECPAQLLRYLEHFTSREAMDIDGGGPAVLRQMVEAGLVQTAADLYKLTAEDLEKLEEQTVGKEPCDLTALDNELEALGSTSAQIDGLCAQRESLLQNHLQR